MTAVGRSRFTCSVSLRLFVLVDGRERQAYTGGVLLVMPEGCPVEVRYPFMIRSCGLAAALLLVAVRALGADVTPTPSSAPTAPPTRDQIVQFLNAMKYELTPNSGKIVVDVVNAAKMPVYDPLAHYTGMPDGSTPTIQVAGHPNAADADVHRALSRAFSLAVMDDGESGPYWKDLYDKASAKDAAQPSAALDPYRYRHELADVADAIMAANKSNGNTP